MNVSKRPWRLHRLLAALTVLGATLVALASTGAAAMATIVPPPGGGTIPPPGPSQVAPAVTVAGGMPGWEITLIAIGAALVAAVLAVLAERARAAHRRPVTAA
jgi:hypothetical protein